MTFQTRMIGPVTARGTGQAAGSAPYPASAPHAYHPRHPCYWDGRSYVPYRSYRTQPAQPARPSTGYHNHRAQGHAPPGAPVAGTHNTHGTAGPSVPQPGAPQPGGAREAPSTAPGAELSGTKLHEYYRQLKARETGAAPAGGAAGEPGIPRPVPSWPGSRILNPVPEPEVQPPRPSRGAWYSPMPAGLTQNKQYAWLLTVTCVPVLMLMLLAAIDAGSGAGPGHDSSDGYNNSDVDDTPVV